jgi:hypothetical protein
VGSGFSLSPVFGRTLRPKPEVRLKPDLSLLARLASIAAAVALLSTGCAGSSPEEDFAASLCSRTVPFAREMLEAIEQVERTTAKRGRDARATLARHVFDGKQIAARYAARVRSVAHPDSKAGIRAKKFVDFSAAGVVERVRRDERYVRRLPEDISLESGSLQRVHSTFVFNFFEMKSLPWTIRQFVPELRAAFRDAESCEELDAIGQ